MSEEVVVLVGTTGNGVWRSEDGGASFDGVRGLNGIDVSARGFAVDPHDSRHVIVGLGLGGPQVALHESRDAGKTWQPVGSFPHLDCWRITFDPIEPGRYFVGTRPAGLYRTEDGGRSFQKLSVDLADTCPDVGIPRITAILVHPTTPEVVFVSIEVDGILRSLDGGDTWERVMTDIQTPVPNGQVYGTAGRMDGHFVTLSAGDPDLVVVTTPDGLYASDDLGQTWADFPSPQVFDLQYYRETAVKLDDPSTIFQGVGDLVNGKEGALLRTRCRGASWDVVSLPDECNSPVWCFAQHPADPDLIFTCTHKGMLFGTEDGGQTWSKYRREFSEVRGMCWLPG
jgi:photosystem II stability/assembly factor-like uncharacterized protein